MLSTSGFCADIQRALVVGNFEVTLVVLLTVYFAICAGQPPKKSYTVYTSCWEFFKSLFVLVCFPICAGHPDNKTGTNKEPA